MKILILGGQGQLASDLGFHFRQAGDEVISLGRQALDVCDPGAVTRGLEEYRPEVAVNCTVFHPVDECERLPHRSFEGNAIAPYYLAAACRTLGVKLVHFSSDYVFDGEATRPYLETDCARPRTVFGVSKLAGELMIQNTLRQHYIIRTSGLYGLTGSRVKGGNFVETMLRIGREKGVVSVVNDLRMAQTSTADLAAQTRALISTDHFGLFHASNHGDYSWYEFALQIFQAAGMKVEVKPVSHAAFPSLAPRPRYSVLQNARLASLGLDVMQAIPQALAAYLAARARTTVSA